jgi:hypothetical protein
MRENISVTDGLVSFSEACDCYFDIIRIKDDYRKNNKHVTVNWYDIQRITTPLNEKIPILYNSAKSFWSVDDFAWPPFNLACIPNAAGVYILFFKDSIQYVGQSKDIQRRVYTHRGNKDFSYVAWVMQRNDRKRYEMEKEYIHKMSPSLNKMIYKTPV